MTKKQVMVLQLLLLGLSPTPATAESYSIAFSSYLGGSAFEHARDIFVDSNGAIYIVGGTASAGFPTTPGAHDRSYDSSGNQVGPFGHMDAFVVKLSASGKLLWSTLLGGPNYDRAYAVEVDDQGYVYVAGRAGPGFPTTQGSLQPSFNGYNESSSYGWQNAFVTKLEPDGSGLVWSSYVGISSLSRDLALDAQKNIYVTPGYPDNPATQGQIDSAWYTGRFQDKPQGGRDSGVAKIKGDGSAVLWATWLGGSGHETIEASIRVDPAGQQIFVAGSTYSTDFPTTAGAADRTHGGKVDFYVARLSPDGKTLIYGTYLGGDGDEWMSTHNLAIDQQGNAYAAFPTGSSSFLTTPGAYQSKRLGTNDWGVVKLSPTGALLASTLLGGSGTENPDGIYVNPAGGVFISGQTSSTDFPTTPTPIQAASKGGEEAVVVRLSPDLGQLLYASYLGGKSDDAGRSGYMDAAGNLYVTGSSSGAGWPAVNAHQATYAGGTKDCIVAALLRQSPPVPDGGPQADASPGSDTAPQPGQESGVQHDGSPATADAATTDGGGDADGDDGCSCRSAPRENHSWPWIGIALALIVTGLLRRRRAS